MTAAVDLAAVVRARVALAAIARAHPELAERTAMVRLAAYVNRHDDSTYRRDTITVQRDTVSTRGDTTMADDTQTFTARLPRALLAALDTEAQRLGALAGGITVSRNDALRVTLQRALAAAPVALAAPLAASAAPPAVVPADLSARRAVDRTPAAPPPSAEAVRVRYRAALDAKKLQGKATAETVGCSEAQLRKWSKGESGSLPGDSLARLIKLLDKAGL